VSINFSNIAEVDWILENNKTLTLFKKDNASLIISFLYHSFKVKNKSSYLSNDLISNLSDYLFKINNDNDSGKERFPMEAKVYLENWAKEGFLRQTYIKEDAVFELTPATEKALNWLTELNKPEFVGAESRLLQIFNLLRELSIKSSDDIELRKYELLKEKSKIDEELLKIQSGEYEKFDERLIKEKFSLLEESVGKLLSDFRQIEENFRSLNTKAREDQIKKNLTKGKYLKELFMDQDIIMNTPQGKSFEAFYDFLMNPGKQEELDELIDKILALDELKDLKNNNQIGMLKENLVDSGDKVNKTTRSLSEQLRRFLDSTSFQESKRVLEIINEIEAVSLSLKNNPPAEKDFMLIDDKPKLSFPMEFELFSEDRKIKFNTGNIEISDETFEVEALFKQQYIDPKELMERIESLLKNKKQITLKEIVEEIPVEKGLAEIIAYFSIATNKEKNLKAVINEEQKERIPYFIKNERFEVEIPQTIFIK
jgi:hypothetical protein